MGLVQSTDRNVAWLEIPVVETLSPCLKVTAGFAFTSYLKMFFFFFLRLQQNFHLVLPESNICLVLFENEFTFHLLMPHLLIRKHCRPLAWTVNQCLFMAFSGTVSRVSLCAVSTNFQFPASAKSLFFNLWMLSFRRSNTIKFSCRFLPCGHFSINFLYFLILPHKQVLYFPLQTACCIFWREKKDNLFWGLVQM